MAQQLRASLRHLRCVRGRRGRQCSTRGSPGNESSQSGSGNTVDQSEAAKFNSVEWSWWNANGPAKALHTMNALRVPLIKNTLLGLPPDDIHSIDYTPYPLDGCTILEIGSGGGILCEPLARLGSEVTGVEPTQAGVATAREHAVADAEIGRRVRYWCGSVEEFVREEGGQFDAVVASEVVEHLADLPSFVRELCTLVKPGGSAIFTTINRTAVSFALVVVAAEYLFGVVPRGTHMWNKFVTPTELSQQVEANGLGVEFIRGMDYNVFTNRWSWSEADGVNYALVATRPGGEREGDQSDLARADPV